MEHYCPHRFCRQFGFHQDIPASMDSSILPSSKIMLRLHQGCVRYGTNSRVLFPGPCLSLEKKFTSRFQEWWSKVFLASSETHSGGNLKRKRDGSPDVNIQRNEGPSGSRPKLKIIISPPPLRSPILETEDSTPEAEIPGVGVPISVTPISAIPTRSIAPPPRVPAKVRLISEPLLATSCEQKLKSIIVCAPGEQDTSEPRGSKVTYEKTIFSPPADAENIMDILDCDPSLTECMVILLLSFFFSCLSQRPFT